MQSCPIPTRIINHGWHSFSTILKGPKKLMRLHHALIRQQRGDPARFYCTGGTSTPTLHTAWPQRRRLGTSRQTLWPRLQPPLPGAALPPLPGPRVPAQLPLLRKPESGRRASRLQAGPGRQHSRRHSSLTHGLSPRLRNEPSRGSRLGPPAGLANALGAGRLLPAVGSAAPRQRRSPGNRGSFPEAESRRA